MNLLLRLWGLWLLAAVTLAFALVPAFADQPVYQNGTALKKHVPAFQSNGRVIDSGNQLGVPGGGVDSLAIINPAVPKPVCFYDAIPSGGPAHSLCIGPAGLDVQTLGGASPSTFNITIDGVPWGGGGGGPSPPVASNCLLISGTTTNCLLISGTSTNALLIR